MSATDMGRAFKFCPSYVPIVAATKGKMSFSLWIGIAVTAAATAGGMRTAKVEQWIISAANYVCLIFSSFFSLLSCLSLYQLPWELGNVTSESLHLGTRQLHRFPITLRYILRKRG